MQFDILIGAVRKVQRTRIINIFISNYQLISFLSFCKNVFARRIVLNYRSLNYFMKTNIFKEVSERIVQSEML